MKKSLILGFALLLRVAGVCGNDSIKMHARFEVQLNAGFYNSSCINSPPGYFDESLKSMSGIQFMPGCGVSLNWRLIGIGLSTSFFVRGDIKDKYQNTLGLLVLVNFDLATWNTGTPVGARISAGILPFGFVPTDQEGASQRGVPAYYFSLAPVFRLNPLNSSATILLGPSLDFTFGQSWNRETTVGSGYSGKFTKVYEYLYNSMSANLLLIVKFNNPLSRKKTGSKHGISAPFMPFPPPHQQSK